MSELITASVAGRRKYVALAMLLALSLVWWNSREARAAAYVNPFYATASGAQESAITPVAARAMSPEGVDLRTGELFWHHSLLRTPGVLNDRVFSFTWRSMINGSSQLGNGINPNREVTVQLGTRAADLGCAEVGG